MSDTGILEEREPREHKPLLATAFIFVLLVALFTVTTMLVNTGFYDHIQTVAGVP